MRRVSGAALLRIWEHGQGRHPLDQAMAILAEAFPEVAMETLAALSIGQRDTYWLEVYKYTFGGQLDALVDCPQCRATLELPLRADDIHVTPEAEPTDDAGCLHADGYEVRLRLPNNVRSQAKALLRDVHTLAQAYGWREADILAMSEVRRQCYLEMLA